MEAGKQRQRGGRGRSVATPAARHPGTADAAAAPRSAARPSAPRASAPRVPTTRATPAPAIDRTISVQIAREVRRRILSGLYPGGSQLLQDSIAAEFGVSKIPVREALTRRAAEGLVELQAHRGFQVRMMSRAEAGELHDLRLLLEPRISAQGARLAGEREHVETAHALAALNHQVASGAYDDTGELNRDFHLCLATPHLQPVATELLTRLLTLSQRYAQIHLTVPGRPERAIDEHNAIFLAWKKGQAARVERLVTRHIQETREDLVTLLAFED